MEIISSSLFNPETLCFSSKLSEYNLTHKMPLIMTTAYEYHVEPATVNATLTDPENYQLYI